MKSELSALHFHNEEAAFAYVEAKLWPHGSGCPPRGVIDAAGSIEWQERPSWLVEVLRMPQAIHRPHGAPCSRPVMCRCTSGCKPSI